MRPAVLCKASPQYDQSVFILSKPEFLHVMRPRVALDIETSRIYGRRILAGVSQFLVANRPWSIYVEQHEIGSGIRQLLSRWSGDGLISRQLTSECAQLLSRQNLPAIDLSNFSPHLGIPRINSADDEIGRMASQHFVERSFEHVGCCSYKKQFWSERRSRAFVEAAKREGMSVGVLEQLLRTRGQRWDRDQDQMAAWLIALPKPVGIFATNDLMGQKVIDACGRAGLAVPESVAVLGVDDDEVLCSLCNPPLSSIDPDAERIGMEAAKWLERLMQGEQASKDALLEVSPLGITTRQSSDILAVPDPDFAAALRFIRVHACEGATIHDIAAHLAVSRSWLERRFRYYLGRSPQAEIRRTQIKRCKELLRSTKMPLDQVARLAGFKHTEYMSYVFKRETGEAPGRFRNENRSRERK
jgi:LacI family transcriptional regulator